MKSNQLVKNLLFPPVLVENDKYILKFAENETEITAALQLRYEVFKLEQGKGINKSGIDGIDYDDYDQYCQHIIVIDKADQKLVGTYRILPGLTADQGIGFYSSQEFAINGIGDIIKETVEVGRSCVSRDYRSGSVISLLWCGLGTVLARGGFKYLFGCASLDAEQRNEAWALYDELSGTDTASAKIYAVPKAPFILPPGDRNIIEAFKADRGMLNKVAPPLLKGYLRLGSSICSEPAFDQKFGSIDFLILMELANMPKKYYKHFCEGKI